MKRCHIKTTKDNENFPGILLHGDDDSIKLLLTVLNSLQDVKIRCEGVDNRKINYEMGPRSFGVFYVGISIRIGVPEESINNTISILKNAVDFFNGKIKLREIPPSD